MKYNSNSQQIMQRKLVVDHNLLATMFTNPIVLIPATSNIQKIPVAFSFYFPSWTNSFPTPWSVGSDQLILFPQTMAMVSLNISEVTAAGQLIISLPTPESAGSYIQNGKGTNGNIILQSQTDDAAYKNMGDVHVTIYYLEQSV